MLRINQDEVQEILEWTSTLEATDFLTPKNIPAAIAHLESLGWEKVQIGSSSAKHPIWALHWSGTGKRVTAYGYPHPDEPTGASALYALAQRLAHENVPKQFASVDWWLVLCADPDQALLNQEWIEKPSLDSYLEHHWRPIYQHLEVDYQFPINHPPFWQPRGLALRGLTPPLPESLALADLIHKVKPQLLGLMHNNHVSGSYTYLSHRPHESLIQAWDQSNQKFSTSPHWGEKPDPGKRWKTARVDVLKEKRLRERQRQAEKKFGDLTGRRLVGCVSVAQYLESLDSSAVVITPEVGLWQPDKIGSLQLTGQTRKVRIEHKQGRKGWREIVYGELKMPDGSLQEVCYSIVPAEDKKRTVRKTVTLTAGMAGVEAVEHRRWLLSRADMIYNQANLPDETVRLFERSKISVPGPRVNDQSMLIFRTSPRYHQIASEAQVADLQYRWGMQTCLWIAHGLQLYQEQGDSKAARGQTLLLKQAKKSLLSEMPPMNSLENQIRSQVGRLLLTLASL